MSNKRRHRSMLDGSSKMATKRIYCGIPFVQIPNNGLLPI